MDLCYPLETAEYSKSLKYSLQTARENLEFDDIYIVGEKPDEIEAKEILTYDPYLNPIKNVLAKLQVVIDSDVSENFIWMNDDFYIFGEYDEIPYYHKGKIKDQEKDDYWKYRIPNLLKHFPEGRFFEAHFPIVFNKNKLLELIDEFGVREIAQGAHRSYYCNYHGIEGEYTEDYKAYTKDQLRRDVPFLSTTDELEQTPEFEQLFKENH